MSSEAFAADYRAEARQSDAIEGVCYLEGKEDGVREECARIRRELLEAVAEETWTYVPARGERLGVLSSDALKAHLDRICPEP